MMDRTRRGWWETVKTVLLIGLVGLSIVLTWLSWSFRPPFTAAEKNYTALPPLGEEREAGQIVVPEWLVFHAGGEHGLALPLTPLYERTLEHLYQWRLSQVAEQPWDEVDWSALRRRTGIELGFGVTVAPADLPWFGAESGVEPPPGAAVRRLWLVAEENGIAVYLLDDERRQAFRGRLVAEPEAWDALWRASASLPKAAFFPADPDFFPSASAAPSAGSRGEGTRKETAEGTVEDTVMGPAAAAVEQAGLSADNGMLPAGASPAAPDGDGEAGGARERAPFGWYLPLFSPKMEEEVWRWEPIPLASLYPYLFVDPTFIREIVTRDGVLVYTDGSRSLQVEPSRLRTIYDMPVPVPPSVPERGNAGHVKTAVQFVNQYGGWIGDYVLDDVRKFTPDHVRLTFRYYHGAYPVYGLSEDGEDARMVFSTPMAGQVMTLERPLYRLEEKVDGVERPLPDGETVYRRFLDLAAEGRQIRHIRMAYRMEITPSSGGEERRLRLVPGWVFIDAEGRHHWMIAAGPRSSDDE